jgi:hypothetical protein
MAVSVSRRFALPLLAAGLAACGSAPQVRTLGTGGEAPAYELRGTGLSAVHAEAARLCGSGYTVLRESQQYSPARPDDSAASEWLQQAGEWLSGLPGNQAQATVQCRN